MRKPFSAVLLTHGHKDRENIAAIKEPGIVIEGPGEYEVGDVIIEGSESNFEKPEESTQTLYTIRAEEITVAHLADLNHVLSDKQIDALGDVDVLFVPIGGHGLLDADKAAAIVSEIEPRMVVPIYYKIPGVKVTLDDEKKFCKAVGAKSEDATSLSLKKANLPAGEIKIVMLQKS